MSENRLKHSNLEYNAKHPMLLTAKHPIVQILLERAHWDNLHEGTEYVRNNLQQEFWIVGLRNALRKIKSRCVKCRNRNANPIQPQMADLPREQPDKYVCPFTSLYGILRIQVPMTYHEEMVLPLHLSNNQSSTHCSCTVIRHRVVSSCCRKSHCKTCLPEHHHQWLQNKIRWSSQWAENFYEWVGQS